MAEDDIISTLPDAILCHILSFLQTKQSVATRILSKRWNPLWRSVTTLRFNTKVTNQICNFDFNDFVYSVLLSRDATLPIKTFHLDIEYSEDVECPIKSITKWVNFVVQRGVEYLCLYLVSESRLKLPITILNCKTLVVLNLSGFRVEHCCFSSILLPSLKTFHLDYVEFPKLQDFMLFLTGCPILEDLLTSDVSFDSDESFDCSKWMSSLLTNLARAHIDCFSYYFPLKAVHNVQSLRFEFHQVYYHDDMIPTFHNLTQLKLICYDYSKDFLLDVLNHCPKLQSFDLDEVVKTEEALDKKEDKENWVFPDVVPQCLSLHLRTCNLLSFSGLHGELMLVRYILKNASVLQTMKIWNSGQPEIERILSELRPL
ncbi:unnamed protein product [Trifolium pratense]|uniref:Uncharacterized protein n=1 Tax=Trifolium pratense TaxID=57577 RepID=A0ACB0LMJ5_TRIPR|nr:unnamed protein product [Trifolium pratense]